MRKDERYNKRGVSASKEDVHNAIKNIDKGVFPRAFCKIVPDFLGGDENYCNIMHADGAGTKSSLAYLYWKETGDLSVWKGIAQDALIMNIDQDALKNFQASKFDFVDAKGNDVDFNNLSEDVKYTLRDGETVVQDDMTAKDVVDTINDEYGKTINV